MLKFFKSGPKFDLSFVMNELSSLIENEEYQEVLNNYMIMVYSSTVLDEPIITNFDEVVELIQNEIPDEIIEKNKEDLELAGFFDKKPKYEEEWPLVEARVRELLILWSQDASFSRWRCADT